MAAWRDLASALHPWCPLDLSPGEDAAGAWGLPGVLGRGRAGQRRWRSSAGSFRSVLLLLGLASGSARTAPLVPRLRQRVCLLGRADLLNLRPRGAAGVPGRPSSLKGRRCPPPPPPASGGGGPSSQPRPPLPEAAVQPAPSLWPASALGAPPAPLVPALPSRPGPTPLPEPP